LFAHHEIEVFFVTPEGRTDGYPERGIGAATFRSTEKILHLVMYLRGAPGTLRTAWSAISGNCKCFPSELAVQVD
jgi:hypothetical protein